MAETKEEKTTKETLVPRWALIAGGVMLALGIGLGATREVRARGRAVAMLNNAEVRLIAGAENKPITDGYNPYYGCVVLSSNREAYDKLLGQCTTQTDLALDVFRQVLQSGQWQGRALACHMAFYLAQEGRLSDEDLSQMVRLLEDPNEELRRVVQKKLSTLIVVRNVDKKEVYEAIGPAPANAKEAFSAKTVEIEMPEPVVKGDWLGMKWSSPEACLAWWKAFGAELKWNADLKRFALSK